MYLYKNLFRLTWKIQVFSGGILLKSTSCTTCLSSRPMPNIDVVHCGNSPLIMKGKGWARRGKKRGMKMVGCLCRVHSSVFWSLGRKDKFSSKSQTEAETWKFPWSNCWEAFLTGKVLWTSRKTEIRSKVCQRLFNSSKIVARANFPLSLMRTWRVSCGSSSVFKCSQYPISVISSFVLGMRANFSVKYPRVVLENSLISWL